MVLLLSLTDLGVHPWCITSSLEGPVEPARQLLTWKYICILPLRCYFRETQALWLPAPLVRLPSGGECARYLRPSPLSGVRLIMVISYALVMSSALRSDLHPVGEGRNPPSNGIRWPDTLIPCRAAWGLYWRVEGAI